MHVIQTLEDLVAFISTELFWCSEAGFFNQITLNRVLASFK